MFRVRPIEHRDFDTLHAIAVESGAGFTSLPDDPALLRRKIENSIETLARPDTAPGPETYLFVLEATDSGEVVGTCGITAAVGLDMPFYHYHVGTLVHSSRELEIYNEFKVLNLCNDYTGSSELCTLYLVRMCARAALADCSPSPVFCLSPSIPADSTTGLLLR